MEFMWVMYVLVVECMWIMCVLVVECMWIMCVLPMECLWQTSSITTNIGGAGAGASGELRVEECYRRPPKPQPQMQSGRQGVEGL